MTAELQVDTATVPPMVPEPYRVQRVHWELSDTYTLTLVPIDGAAIRFEPGQIVMIYVFGAGEVPISVSSSSRQTDHIELTIRAGGYVTRAGAGLQAGDVVGIRGPFGTPWPLESASGGDLLIVAGGIGLAPLRSVIYEAIDQREAFGDVAIVYGSRNPDSLLFVNELHAWRSRFDLTVDITVDRAPTTWRGDVGLVTRLLPRLNLDASQTTAMVCGPEIMMRFVGRDLTKLGYSPDRIFLTMERNMKCGIGLCGHCQLGPEFLCKNGPVFPLPVIGPLMEIEEL